MKTCPNCAASLPDFVNVCTKCKFNLDSPPPAKPPVRPAPAPQASPPPVASFTAPSHPTNSNHHEQDYSSKDRATTSAAPAPKKNNLAIYAVVGVLVLVVIGWLVSSKSGSDETKLVKEQAAAEIARAKAEASDAQEQAQKAKEQIEQVKEQASQASTSSSPQVNDLLARAAKCAINDCIGIMILAAQPRNSEAIQVAAGRFGEFNTQKTGDRPTARDLNNKGLAQLKAGNVSGAIDLFSRASQTDPNDSEILGNLGYALIQVGRLDEADKALGSALLVNPRRTATWGALAELFAKKPNSSEAATRCLQLGYEFSGNREKTLQFFTDSSATSDRPEMRPVYTEAVRRIRAYN